MSKRRRKFSQCSLSSGITCPIANGRKRPRLHICIAIYNNENWKKAGVYKCICMCIHYCACIYMCKTWRYHVGEDLRLWMLVTSHWGEMTYLHQTFAGWVFSNPHQYTPKWRASSVKQTPAILYRIHMWLHVSIELSIRFHHHPMHSNPPVCHFCR